MSGADTLMLGVANESLLREFPSLTRKSLFLISFMRSLNATVDFDSCDSRGYHIKKGKLLSAYRENIENCLAKLGALWYLLIRHTSFFRPSLNQLQLSTYIIILTSARKIYEPRYMLELQSSSISQIFYFIACTNVLYFLLMHVQAAFKFRLRCYDVRIINALIYQHHYINSQYAKYIL
jgi:hypothetical protein